MPLHPVRDKQARQTQGQLAHAFLQRNGQCRIGWQSEQCAQEDKAALECTQRSRQHERCDTNAGAKAFEDKRIDHAEGSGCPKACITNQTSPASAAHPIRRKTLARSMIGPVRYAATIASSAIDESIVPRHGILGRPPERGGLQTKLPCCLFIRSSAVGGESCGDYLKSESSLQIEARTGGSVLHARSTDRERG
jgi:hypothetical protein